MKKKLCKGDMMLGDDGNVFWCNKCGYEVQRTRMNPMPDTDHEPRRKKR